MSLVDRLLVSSPPLLMQTSSHPLPGRRLFFDLPIAQRLTVGFLLAALIAATTTGIIGLQHVQSLRQQADFDQYLLENESSITLANQMLFLLDRQSHTVLDTASSHISRETLSDNQKTLHDLSTRYEGILFEYRSHRLLGQHPEQVSLLEKANHAVYVTRQQVLADSAWRTWQVYHKALEQFLQDILSDHIADAEFLEHFQIEPTHADTQSALNALSQFNKHIIASMQDTTRVQEQEQLVITSFGAVLAAITIILAGLLVSRTLVQRLGQLKRVTQSVGEGKLHMRVPIIGHDEIADVSEAVNSMVDTIVEKQYIAAAYKQQQQLNEFKDQFILNVTHELRNPLSNVYGFLELLHDYHQQLDEQKRMSFLDNAMYSCRELMHLINNMLDATYVGREVKPPHLEEVFVGQVVDDVLQRFDPRMLEDFTVQVDIPSDMIAWADQQYLRQIVRNLISNAFKYSPRKTVISIRATLSEAMSDDQFALPEVCIAVKDSGPGIPPDEIPFLFQKFVRLKRDLRGDVKGTGLGLYVSKLFVEAMNGRIWVESTGIAGEGSRFCFTLPAFSSTALSLDDILARTE